MDRSFAETIRFDPQRHARPLSRLFALSSTGAEALAAAPTDDLQWFGDKAHSIAELAWALLILSVVVIAIKAASTLLAALIRGTRHSAREAEPEPIMRRAGGLFWIIIGVALSVIALVGAMTWTAYTMASIDRPPREPALTNSAGGHSGGDPRKGAEEIVRAGCGACHSIPGIANANGVVGPPLTEIGRRVFIAGLLRNTPENLRIWLRNPQKIAPGNAMPDLGLSEEQSADIAAYLYTLH